MLHRASGGARLPGDTVLDIYVADALPLSGYPLPPLALACISAASPSLRTSSAVALNAPSDLPPLD